MKFEGEEVDGYKVTLRQFKGDLDVPLAAHEVVELKVLARVTEVNHGVNQRDHKLYRTHVLKVQEVEVL